MSDTLNDSTARVKQIIVDHLGVKEADVTGNKSFIDDFGADSLDSVEIIMAIEDEFDCVIPDDLAEKLFTVQDAIDMVEKTRG